MRKVHLFILGLLATALHGLAQSPAAPHPIVTVLPQRAFPKTIPPGNYSGIAWLGGERYAVVSDKSEEDGFFVFEIKTDSLTGELLSARNTGFHGCGLPNRDDEGIAYCPQQETVWISGEADNHLREYTLDGRRTGRDVAPTGVYRHLGANLGLEALTYHAASRTLWTCNESDTVFIQSYDSLLRPRQCLRYRLDAPVGDARKAHSHAHGIGTLCALDDGSLLLLEREFWVPRAKLGAFVNCKLFHLTPPPAKQGNGPAAPMDAPGKTLVAEWRTRLTLAGRSLANYEGMCLGPTLADGSRVIVLVADSQNQYGGVLKDWIKTLRLAPQQTSAARRAPSAGQP